MFKSKSKIKFISKILILLVSSCLVHFLYDWFSFGWLKILAPTSESVFQHMRIFFTVYIIFSLFEYNFIYKTANYWISRFLILLLIPWVMAIIYLLPQAFTGKMPNEILETFWAIISTTLVWLAIIPLEKDLEKVKYSQTVKVIISVLFILFLLSSVIFTFNVPVYDIFSEPITLY